MEEFKIKSDQIQHANKGVNQSTCDFLKLYLTLNDFNNFQNNLKQTLSSFIDNMDVQDPSISGFKLFKKKMDLLKSKIEDELTDKEIKEIFEQPNDMICSIDSEKAIKYMHTNIFYSLEERYTEIKEKEEGLNP